MERILKNISKDLELEVLREIEKRECLNYRPVNISHNEDSNQIETYNVSTKNNTCHKSTIIFRNNSATNWLLVLIAFLLFFMLCTNPNFE